MVIFEPVLLQTVSKWWCFVGIYLFILSGSYTHYFQDSVVKLKPLEQYGVNVSFLTAVFDLFIWEP